MVLAWAEEYLPKKVNFVGGHPLAGKETSGPETADGNLFKGKAYCIVPSPRADQKAVAQITNLAEAVGARPLFIGVDEHDSFVAAVSHLPFLMSVALVSCASKSANWEDIAQLASSGFNDLSRLASGDPVMHRDICVSNPQPIVAWIDAYIRELYEVRNMLDDSDGPRGEELHQLFEDASLARAKWLAGLVSSQTSTAMEIPSFSENMGQMFMGQKAMDAQKRFFGNLKDGSSKTSSHAGPKPRGFQPAAVRRGIMGPGITVYRNYGLPESRFSGNQGDKNIGAGGQQSGFPGWRNIRSGR